MSPASARRPGTSVVDHTQGRRLASALATVVGGLYLTLLFLVADAESGRAENTYGAYLLLALVYLAGAVLLVAVRGRSVLVVGAAVQMAVIALFAMFGAGAFGPGAGVFDYDALSALPMELWAAVITGSEVLLLALLAYLALARRGDIADRR